MLFCTKCGSQVDEDSKFCTVCGTAIVSKAGIPPVPDNTIPMTSVTKQKKKTKKASKKLASVLVVVIAVVTLGILSVSTLQWYLSPEQSSLRALERGDYKKVMEILNEDRSVRDSEKMFEHLKKRLAIIKADFTANTMDYATVQAELEAIAKLEVEDIAEILAETDGYVRQLNQSRLNFSTAESLFGREEYPEAMEYYKNVIEDDGNYQTARLRIAEACNLYRTNMLDSAAHYAANSEYISAISVLQSALVVIPNDAQIQQQIALYERDLVAQKKEQALSNAAGYAKRGDYVSAMHTIMTVLETQKSDAELNAAYTQYCNQYINTVLVVADEKMTSAAYLDAMKEVEGGIAVVGKDSRLTGKLELCQNAYVAEVIAKADVLMSNKEFDQALKLCRQALKNVPDNTELNGKITEIQAKEPISITKLLAVNMGYWAEWNSGTPKDTFGNDYSTDCNYVVLHGYDLGISSSIEHYVEYRLYGKYETLSGMIATHIDSPEDRINRLQIYADDVLVYTSVDLGRKTDAIEFSLDVSGVEYVKIVVYTEARAKAILSDVQLWP